MWKILNRANRAEEREEGERVRDRQTDRVQYLEDLKQSKSGGREREGERRRDR